MNEPASVTPDLQEDKYCPACGYDLRGITSDRCPECGLDVRGASQFTVPWQDRKRIGRVRAFIQTVILATFRPGRLARAMSAPMDRPSAKRFRWIVVTASSGATALLWLYGTWLFGAVSLQDVADPHRVLDGISLLWELKFSWSAGAEIRPVVAFGIILTFVLASYLTRFPRNRRLTDELQARSIALAAYAQGPLAWLAIAAIALGVEVGLEYADLRETYRELAFLMACFAVTALVFAIIGYPWTGLRVLLRQPHSSAIRRIAASAWVPVAWSISVVIGLGLVPFLAGLTRIAIDSLR